MPPSTPPAQPVEAPASIHAFVESFEAAQTTEAFPEPDQFLPPPGHLLRPAALRELLRVDLEHRWTHGRPRRLDEYRSRFPELFADPVGISEVAFEEYRQRLLAGERPDVAEYRDRYGVAVDGWPAPDDADLLSRTVAQPVPAVVPPDDWRQSLAGQPLDPEALAELHRNAPDTVERLAAGVATLPAVGGQFLNFELVGELGRGAFGRVFLARQAQVAGRLVALKVSVELDDEVKMLGQLQHTNIVPVYSVHRNGPLRALCMPYFGATTLAQVCHHLWQGKSHPVSGRDLLTTLPPAGQLRGQGSEDRGQKSDSSLTSDPCPLTPEPLTKEPPPAVSSPVIREMLGGMSFVEAVLWLGARLADGLAHAHERGVLHRDLKPANVLLTDEGQPMLLDFNMAGETGANETGPVRIGGTLPYMAPEHLEAFRRGGRLDARCDLYALGVLLYELLTGRSPHAVPRGSLAAKVETLIAARGKPPPRLRPYNSAVSPATEAIVRRLLAPDPARRYPSARALQEDLERQIAHRPLRHTPEPSWSERATKWVRRHPRWAAGLVAVAFAAAMLLPPGWLVVQHRQAVAAAEAEASTKHAAQQLAEEQARLYDARYFLNNHSSDPENRQKGLRLGREVLTRYGVAEGSHWLDRPAVQLLSASEREWLMAELGELLLTMAREAPRAGTGDRAQALRDALAYNRLAEDCFGDTVPAGLWQQRAVLLEELGRGGEAGPLRHRAAGVTSASDLDLVQQAHEHRLAGRFREALDLFLTVTKNAPRNYEAWSGAGYCYSRLSKYPEARECYTVCVLLRPDSPWGYYNRGLVRLRQGDASGALTDFDKATKLKPDLTEAYIDRAQAHIKLKQFAEAEADLTRALKLGDAPRRVYFLRADVRRNLKNQAGADQDQAEGLRQTPTDEASFVVRGLARAEGGDPQGALADFTAALRINERSQDALTDQVYVLAEKLGKLPEAIAVLDRLLALYPDDLNALGSRAVYHARLGHVAEARRDARECHRRDQTPYGLFQQAGVYALLSKQDTTARPEALRLLAMALSGGFNDFKLLDEDPDLGPIHSDPEFRRLAETAKALQPRPGS